MLGSTIQCVLLGISESFPPYLINKSAMQQEMEFIISIELIKYSMIVFSALPNYFIAYDFDNGPASPLGLPFFTGPSVTSFRGCVTPTVNISDVVLKLHCTWTFPREKSVGRAFGNFGYISVVYITVGL